MARSTKPKPDAEAQPEAQPTPLSFEGATEKLSAIVAKLEGGELPLEQALALFEEGTRIARQAQTQLDAAEQRVEELLGADERNGEPRTRPLQ